MSRYTGPTTRVNRRFGQAIFPPTKAFENKPYLPGIHGPRLRRKVSDYAKGLLEKQKARYIYGLQEKQFRLTFERAKSVRGVTGAQFLILLETRLDSVVYLMGFAKTRRAARQMVNHGHIFVDGHKVDIASYACRAGEVLEVRDHTHSRQMASQSIESTQGRPVPAWLTVDGDAFRGKINRLPTRDEIGGDIDEQLIVGFYSR